MPGTGDTAVIHHLYEEHGVTSPAAQAGCSPFALGPQRERLVLSRDRVAPRPVQVAVAPLGLGLHQGLLGPPLGAHGGVPLVRQRPGRGVPNVLCRAPVA